MNIVLRFLTVLLCISLNPLAFSADLAAEESVDPPWTLRGDGYIIVTKSSTAQNLEDAAIPDELVDRYVNDINITMLVDYRDSPVGPYGELLYMPGNFRFADGKRHFSITRIYVDSLASLEDGRRNWGIPKELAEFSFEPDGRDRERVTVRADGEVFAEMRLTTFGPPFPVNTVWIPEIFRTLGEVLNGWTYVFALSGTGHARLVHFEPLYFDPVYFPDMNQRHVIAAFRVENFTLEFPIPEVFETP